jgi:broad specificity phosphatase PhoE
VTEIILVRHGQANSHATDEASYDQLSPLGHQEAAWLGEHLATTNPHFDHVLTGNLSRQADTARSMGYQIDTQDGRLDELSYFSIAHALQDQHAIPVPDSPAAYASHLPQLLTHWEEDRISGVPERFEDFSTQIRDMLDHLCQMEGRILAVTSGGVIGMIMRHALGLDNAGTARIMLQIMNSSVHRLSFVHNQLMVAGFNATPHLDHPDRAHARTHV